MKTIEIKLYKFEELSEEAKQTAISEYRGKGIDTQYMYDEAYESVKAFNELFGLREGNRSWLDFDTTNIDVPVYEMEGLRLRTWLMNNVWSEIFTPKWIASIETASSTAMVKHNRVKPKLLSNGVVYNPYYSGYQLECSCPFTGLCYDMDLLDPVLNFIAYKSPECFNRMDFDDLLTECFSTLKNTLESEVEYANSDEAIEEAIEANDYDFTEYGKTY